MYLRKHLKDFKTAFVREFSSVKLAVALFICLAITSLIGTILPEEPMVGTESLIKRYGLEKYHLLKSLGLTDVFHCWWYLALFTTLGINLTVASITRVFPKSTRAFAWPVELKEEGIKKLQVNCEIEVNGTSCVKTIEEKLKKRNYRTKMKDCYLLAVKGGWHKLGASVTHVGILTLFIGSALGILTGFNGIAELSENEGFYLSDLGANASQIRAPEPQNHLVPISKTPLWFGKIPPYLVRVNKTWRENYKTGQVKQWYSDLSIFDSNKKELIRKTIFVNNPLQFMGLDIYQSSWGRFVQVSFNNEAVSLPLENFHGEEATFIPLNNEASLKLRVVSPPGSNILELYSILTNKGVKEKFLGKIEANQNLQLGPLNIKYFGVQTLTGLQFKSNPGSFFIYVGLLLISAGVFIAFGSRKQIWALVNTRTSKIIIGGKSDRAKQKFFEEFEKLILDLSIK